MKKLLVVALLMTSSAFAAGNAANGKKLYKKINCTMCHKADGMGKVADVAKIKITKGPRIAGLDAAYIVEQMTAVQTKKRKTKNTSMMMAKIKKLTKQDIADIAAYVSTMGPKHKGMFQK